jgi:hypothetical protein
LNSLKSCSADIGEERRSVKGRDSGRQSAWIGAAIAVSALAFVLGQAMERAIKDVTTCPPSARRMPRAELIFGFSRRDQPEVTDAEWLLFLDGEITPRFPDGLTVLDAYGQWRRPDGQITKEKSRMLLIWADIPGAEERLEAIRSAWKSRFAQDSVLRVDGSDCVRF